MLKGFDMKLTRKLLNQYKRADKDDKKKKGRMLTEYCRLTGVSRNTASKRFRKLIRNPYPVALARKDKGRKRGPKRKYSEIHRRVIGSCWELSGHLCGENLHPTLGVYLNQLKKENKLKSFSEKDILLAKEMSLATLKRVVARFPKTNTKKHKGNALIYRQVPIVANFGRFAKEKPGFVEVDFVEHNGGSSSGTFAVTGVYVDLFSQWVARAAGLGKNLQSVTEIDQLVHQKILHPLHHYHPDNDKSILKVLFEKMRNGKEKKKQPFQLSRSRPYKKNDNAHVEQKNNDKVRKLVGCYRYDTEKEIDLLNRLYQKADLLDNFFIASAKLKTKIRNNQGRVIKRVHDLPKTPHQRLMENKDTSPKTKQVLKKIYSSLNMVKLRQEINQILDQLAEIQLEKHGKTE